MTLFKNYLENEIADLEAAGTGLAAATPFTVEVQPNVLTGIGNMNVLVFPIGFSEPVLAFKLVGDAFPRMVIGSTGDGIYLGDGSVDPTTNVNLGWDQGTFFVYHGDLDMTTSDKGVVLHSPDNTSYRIKVANDGTLSTEPVI